MRRPVLNSFSPSSPSLLVLNKTAMETINLWRARGVIIALIGNGKGGCGKSTLTMNTAIGYGWDRKRVLIIDADMEQLTTKNWPRSARHANPKIIACATVDILETLAVEIAHYDVVLIDFPGRDDRAIAPVMDVADILISPTKPSYLDMKELDRFIDVAGARRLPHVVVFNEATREQTTEIQRLREAFVCFEPFLLTAMQQLSSYRRVYAQGDGVLAIKGIDPAKENFRRVFNRLTAVIDAAHASRVSALP